MRPTLRWRQMRSTFQENTASAWRRRSPCPSMSWAQAIPPLWRAASTPLFSFPPPGTSARRWMPSCSAAALTLSLSTQASTGPTCRPRSTRRRCCSSRACWRWCCSRARSSSTTSSTCLFRATSAFTACSRRSAPPAGSCAAWCTARPCCCAPLASRSGLRRAMRAARFWCPP